MSKEREPIRGVNQTSKKEVESLFLLIETKHMSRDPQEGATGDVETVDSTTTDESGEGLDDD